MRDLPLEHFSPFLEPVELFCEIRPEFFPVPGCFFINRLVLYVGVLSQFFAGCKGAAFGKQVLDSFFDVSHIDPLKRNTKAVRYSILTKFGGDLNSIFLWRAARLFLIPRLHSLNALHNQSDEDKGPGGKAEEESKSLAYFTVSNAGGGRSGGFSFRDDSRWNSISETSMLGATVETGM